MSHLRLILHVWPLWAFVGAVIGFVLSMGIIDVQDGPTEDDRVLRVVVGGLTIHTENCYKDSVWRRGRIWGAGMLATLIVLDVDAALALRGLLAKAYNAPAEVATSHSPATSTTIFEKLQAILGVTLLSFLGVTAAAGLHHAMYPDFHPPRAFQVVLIAIPPAALLAMAVTERSLSLSIVTRRIGQGIMLLYVLAGAIGILGLVLGSIG
jgi:hypothetical protein